MPSRQVLKAGKIVFRRVRGKIVPIKVQSGSFELDLRQARRKKGTKRKKPMFPSLAKFKKAKGFKAKGKVVAEKTKSFGYFIGASLTGSVIANIISREAKKIDTAIEHNIDQRIGKALTRKKKK